MSDTGPFRPQTTAPFFASPALPAAAFAGVRTRRLIAFALDMILVSILVAVLWSALLVVTFGLSAFLLPSFWPLVAFFYNGMTVSGVRMGTPGMRAMDLQVRAVDGSRVSFMTAAVHAILLYASWFFFPVFLVSLLAADKRCLHDMVAGVIVVRRPG